MTQQGTCQFFILSCLSIWGQKSHLIYVVSLMTDVPVARTLQFQVIPGGFLALPSRGDTSSMRH
jgi:hypothetical protein